MTSDGAVANVSSSAVGAAAPGAVQPVSPSAAAECGSVRLGNACAPRRTVGGAVVDGVNVLARTFCWLVVSAVPAVHVGCTIAGAEPGRDAAQKFLAAADEFGWQRNSEGHEGPWTQGTKVRVGVHFLRRPTN